MRFGQIRTNLIDMKTEESRSPVFLTSKGVEQTNPTTSAVYRGVSRSDRTASDSPM
jgi:hypothetical protein